MYLNLGLENLITLTNSCTYSLEEFKTRHKDVAQLVLNAKQYTKAEIAELIKPGDILFTYPKVRENARFDTKWWEFWEKLIYGMSFTSVKIVFDDKHLAGYGASCGDDSDIVIRNINSFLNDIDGMLIARTNFNIDEKKVQKIKEFVYNFVNNKKSYDYVGVAKGTLQYLLHIQRSYQQINLPPSQIKTLCCSSFVNQCLEYAGIHLNIEKGKYREVMPINMLRAKNIKIVGSYFGKNQIDSTVKSKLTSLISG